MRKTLMTANQKESKQKGCRLCGGKGWVKGVRLERVVCIRCSGKGSGYATKSKGDGNGLAGSG